MLVLGASLGAAGMATEKDWLIYTAMGVIALGLILAIMRKRIANRDKPTLEE